MVVTPSAARHILSEATASSNYRGGLILQGADPAAVLAVFTALAFEALERHSYRRNYAPTESVTAGFRPQCTSLKESPHSDCYTVGQVAGKRKRTVMADHNSESSQVAEVWDNYWHGDPNGAEFASSGARHPIILSFWDEYFRTIKDQYETLRIIDIASGNGALVNCAKIVFGEQPVDFTCVDVSSSAISSVEQLFPDVHGVVADARSIPLDSSGYDVATSQFGIEYAGLDAIDEVTRLIAPGGQLALLLHNQAGDIYRQCSMRLKAIEKFQESKFIPDAITLFEEGFAAVRGADRAKYEAAGRQFQLAVQKVESIFDQHGEHVADGTIMRFFNDILKVHSRIQHSDPSEVLNWLNNMQSQVQAFAGRMTSMCSVAIDANVFDELCEKIRAQKFEILRSTPLTNPEDDVAYAWVLLAARA